MSLYDDGSVASSKIMLTLEQVLAIAEQLPLDQQEMLIEILHKRHVEKRRAAIAQDARASIQMFRDGKLKPQPVEEIIETLRQSLNNLDDN